MTFFFITFDENFIATHKASKKYIKALECFAESGIDSHTYAAGQLRKLIDIIALMKYLQEENEQLVNISFCNILR